MLTERPLEEFFCETCREWTPSVNDLDDCETAWCERCGENYTCGECGAHINVFGECLACCHA